MTFSRLCRAIAAFVLLASLGGQAAADTRTTDQLEDSAPTTFEENVRKTLKSKSFDLLTCVSCHTDVKGVQHRSENHHHRRCENCHIGGNAHRQSLIRGDGGKGSIAKPENKECIACHKNDRKLMDWAFNVHNKAGGNCRDCHANHVSQDARNAGLSATKTDKHSAACIKCHQDTGSQFRMRSHHPIPEGGMGCTGCHNPHGSDHAALKSRSDQCLSCHQSHRGPKVFEHAPVVDDCVSCHNPHGSPNRGLLSVSQPAVCLQCHSIAAGKHGYGTGVEPALTAGTRPITGTVLRQCTNCHGAIHGSHQDPLLRY